VPCTGIKSIALTAHALEEEQREIMAAGCNDVMCKPYKYEEIIDALAKNLGVRFVYEEETTSAAAAAAQQPDTASLAALPKGLMDALKHALGMLDIGGVDRTIRDIRAHDPSLGDALAAMAKDFRYSEILQLIGTARSYIGREDQS
jgi:CheY-like chemotaxis protein